MNLKDIGNKWKNIISNMNSCGIPIPLIRDPKTGTGSVSLTLVFLSFNTWLISVIGKAAGALGGMNTDQCLSMFISVAALYFGRKFQTDSKGKIEISSTEEEKRNEGV